MFRNSATIALAALFFSSAAFAGSDKIMIEDAYARSSNPKVAAVFMHVVNDSDADDRLVAATSEAAARVELHTHKETGDGVMKMMQVEDGFAVPAAGKAMLQRGGDHVMLMGLVDPLADGDVLKITLTFEQAGDITIEVPVDNDRKPKHGHSGH